MYTRRVVRYCCEKCHRGFPTRYQARVCETKALHPSYARVGDTVVLRKHHVVGKVVAIKPLSYLDAPTFQPGLWHTYQLTVHVKEGNGSEYNINAYMNEYGIAEREDASAASITVV
jgi:hypothetical protein